MIKYHEFWFNKKEEKEIIDVFRSGWLTTGLKTKKFEKDFQKYTKSKFAIGLNSCTSALHLSLVALGIKKNDEVITSDITFPATANVIVHCGAKPVFIDVRNDNLNLDENKIEQAITSKTKAIIPVHFAGHPCEMDKIKEIAEKYNLKIIEDAAHSIESIYKNKKIGSISDTTCFSFYATKNITTGEGGMITTDNSELEQKIRILSSHGLSKNAWERYSNNGYKFYDLLYPGYKYNMSDIQAALGIQQLKKIENFWQKRKKFAEIYDEIFKDTEEIKVLKVSSNVKTSYHLYVIIVKIENLTVNRDFLINAIQKKGIGVAIHFPPLHLQLYYQQNYKFNKENLKNAEYFGDRLISLPLYPKMKKQDVIKVGEIVKKTIEKYKK
ncbi:MAG: DegT/DnrJ/EryC1/StrS family aminotransferase [bacterium]